MKNFAKLPVLLFAAIALCSCGARVKVSNHEICNDLGRYGADCFRLLTSHERALSKSQWDRHRFGQFCMNAEALAELNAARQALCEDTGRCSYDFQVKADEVMTKIEKRNNKATFLKGGTNQ